MRLKRIFFVLFQVVIGLFLSIIGWFIYVFWAAGQFKPLENLNINKCERIEIPFYCEDTLYHTTTNEVVLSCGYLHDYFSFSGYSATSRGSWKERIINTTSQKGLSTIRLYDSNTKETREIPIQGYPHTHLIQN